MRALWLHNGIGDDGQANVAARASIGGEVITAAITAYLGRNENILPSVRPGALHDDSLLDIIQRRAVPLPC